jgi:hypothetical protein
MKYGKGKQHKQNCPHFSMSKKTPYKTSETVHPNSFSKMPKPTGGKTRPEGFSELHKGY